MSLCYPKEAHKLFTSDIKHRFPNLAGTEYCNQSITWDRKDFGSCQNLYKRRKSATVVPPFYLSILRIN